MFRYYVQPTGSSHPPDIEELQSLLLILLFLVLYVLIYNHNHFRFVVMGDNLETGCDDGKPITVFNYPGEYLQEYDTGSCRKRGLQEVVSEVLQLEKYGQYLVTRAVQDVKRVSLVYIRNGQVRVWTSSFKDILLTLKESGTESGRKSNAIMKELSDKLASTNEVDVVEIVNRYSLVNPSTGFYWSAPRFSNHNDMIPVIVLFALVKHIMVSEDVRYNSPGQCGRQMLLMAFYEYAVANQPMKDILEKYKLPA